MRLAACLVLGVTRVLRLHNKITISTTTTMGATIKIPTPSLISYMLYVLIGFTRDLPCPGALEVTEEGLVNLETLVMLDMAITTITTTNTVTTLKMDTIIAIEVN